MLVYGCARTLSKRGDHDETPVRGFAGGRACSIFIVCCLGCPFEGASDRQVRAHGAANEHKPAGSRTLVRARSARTFGGCSPRRHAEAAGPLGRDGLHHIPVGSQLAELPALPPPRTVRSALRTALVGSGRSRNGASLRRAPPRPGELEPALDP